MQVSLRKFKTEFEERLFNLHWKQWSAFGVSSHWERKSKYALDLEALAVSTFVIGLMEKRLAHVSLEWLQDNRKWLNVHRLRRIGKLFRECAWQNQIPLLENHIMSLYQDFLKPSMASQVIWEESDLYSDNLFLEHINIINSFKPRGVVVEPNINSSCLLQLFLRSIFGIDARADMLLYFLCGRTGNPNYVSNEIHFAQSNLFKVFKNWVEAGVIFEDEEVSSPDYVLKNYNYWIKALGISKPPIYVNWARVYLFLDKLAIGLDNPNLDNDYYLASSFFRDINQDARYAASIAGINLPIEKSYPGKAYFEPFSQCILQVMEKLIQ